MKRAIVTGGTRGIGRAIAEKLRDEMYIVMITGTGPDPNIPGVMYTQINFSDEKLLKKFCKELEELKFDVLINNAGINNIKPVNDVSEQDYDELLDINLKAPYFLSKAAAKSMKENGGGHIINVSSVFGVVSKEKRSMYSTSKAGIIGLTKSLAIELGPDSILVNCISPGFTLTDLTRKSLSKEEMSELEEKIPLKRLAEPYEMAKVVSFLCSENNRYITGQNIIIDGGFTIV